MTTALRVLRDDAADARLREDGFVVVPFAAIEPLVETLRAAYGDLHGWSGEGFEADLTNADRDYRHHVSAVLSELLDVAVTDLAEGFVPFLRVFLCKWPGPDSDLYLHRDWMYVDERAGGRTFVVWIPLQDVVEANGPMQILPGSHRFEDSLRGTHLNAGWVSDADLVGSHLVTVPVALGEAVVLDNAVVHRSIPNQSGEPRLVAGIGLRPAGSPLVHFLRSDEDHAVRYEVDDEFFLSVTPQDLMATPPDLEVAESIVLPEMPPVPPQLAQAERAHAPTPAPAQAHEQAPAPAPPPPVVAESAKASRAARSGLFSRLLRRRG